MVDLLKGISLFVDYHLVAEEHEITNLSIASLVVGRDIELADQYLAITESAIR